MLQALEYLLLKGYRPQRGFYIGLGHDEEVWWVTLASFIKKKDSLWYRIFGLNEWCPTVNWLFCPRLFLPWERCILTGVGFERGFEHCAVAEAAQRSSVLPPGWGTTGGRWSHEGSRWTRRSVRGTTPPSVCCENRQTHSRRTHPNACICDAFGLVCFLL